MIIATYLGFYCEIDVDRIDSDGNRQFRYNVVTPTEVGFTGKDFKTSVGFSEIWHTPKTVFELLEWITLTPDVTDSNHFSDYSAAQWRYAKSPFTNRDHFKIEQALEQIEQYGGITCTSNEPQRRLLLHS